MSTLQEQQFQYEEEGAIEFDQDAYARELLELEQQGEVQAQIDQDAGINLNEDAEEVEADTSHVGVVTPVEALKQLIQLSDKHIANLKAAGIHSIQQAQHATNKALENCGLSEQKSKLLRALESAGGNDFKTGTDVLHARQKMLNITSGSAKVDAILGGGVECGAITEIFGEFNTGKTQFCHTLAVTAQLPRTLGGGEGKVMYIDSEHTFRPERILQIAGSLGYDADQILDNISVAQVRNSDHQAELLQQAGDLMTRERYSMLIVDSSTALLRAEYAGRGQLSDRQVKLGAFLRQLAVIAQSYQVAVVITNQVVSDIAAASAMGGGDNKKAIGGNIMAHASTTRLQFRKGKGNAKVCKIVDSPLLPEAEASFKIDTVGIKDDDAF